MTNEMYFCNFTQPLSLTNFNFPGGRRKIQEKMSSETANSDAGTGAVLNFNETELTLGMPGEARGRKTLAGTKRGFSEIVDLNLGRNPDDVGNSGVTQSENECSDATKPPAKEQVVGWPPVRSYRKNMMKSSCKYVKVAVDGAPYLRKVDLEMYAGYQQLLSALEKMFSCFTILNILNERKLMDPTNGTEYVPTYEDKDGDWMYIGDVPWKMFVESCKRLRLMKSSEAIGLAPRTPSKCSGSS